ncbi:glycosyltransferase [Gelidibacter sp. F2691]|nr:glycosyltransferase [Gelidibacter sp. F2691]
MQTTITNLLYIGQYTEGSTSKMRANQLNKILKPDHFEIIDIHIPFFKTHKIFRSFGFRYKLGPLILNVNNYIQKSIINDKYDIVWVDKGVYINEKTIRILRQVAGKLIHFTPDPAFTFHKSFLFNKSIKYYDFIITTKSFELESYYKLKNKNQVIYVTQGFDRDIHRREDSSFLKKSGVVFLGHHEKEREEVIERLIKHDIDVTLAGIKWERFAEKYRHYKNLNYLGKGVYGKDYVSTIQQAKIAWGAISKWIPELHTTRTFEIPACGTALLTEINSETTTFFNETEAIFYNTTEELMDKVTFYLNNNDDLKELTERGYKKVHEDGYDYESIMRNALRTILS